MKSFNEFLIESTVIPQDKLHEIFNNSEYNYYKKVGTVEARLAIAGERVVTKINGVKETSNVAKKDDVVIKNPAGEEYTLSKSKYSNRYKGGDLNDTYQTVKCTGGSYAIKWALSESKIEALSGESMLILDGDYLAKTALDSNDQYYRIEISAFKQTYRIVK